MENPVIIDFAELEGPVFTGRSRGEQLRKTYHVEECDDRDVEVQVRIPDSTYSISSSFILGMFGKSIVHAGSKDQFYKKYHFQSSALFKGIIDSCVTRALQDKGLFTQ